MVARQHGALVGVVPTGHMFVRAHLCPDRAISIEDDLHGMSRRPERRGVADEPCHKRALREVKTNCGPLAGRTRPSRKLWPAGQRRAAALSQQGERPADAVRPVSLGARRRSGLRAMNANAVLDYFGGQRGGAAAARSSESGYGYSRCCELYRTWEARLSRWLSPCATKVRANVLPNRVSTLQGFRRREISL